MYQNMFKTCYRILITSFFVMQYTAILSYDFIDITQHGYEQYQDIIINNCLIKPASTKIQGQTINHDCTTRYRIIKNILDQYKRPFTMLDIGASQGYYSFKTAYDFPKAVCVMIEGDNASIPAGRNAAGTIVHIKYRA